MRRTLSLAALATLLAIPGAASAAAKAAPAAKPAASAPAAQPASGGGFDLKDVTVAAYLGGEFGDLDGFYLRADAAMPFLQLAPKIQLLGVASLGFTHLGDSNDWFKISWNIVKVTASVRGQMEFAPAISGYADAGLGFYYGGWKSETELIDPFTLTRYTYKADDTTGGLTMRFAVGGLYKINSQLDVGAELGFNPYFGDADTTNFFIGVGAHYKL